MTGPVEPALADRLRQLLDHLGLARAHLASQMPGDLAGFAAAHSDRVAGLVLCVPTRLDPAPFAPVADRLLLLAGDRGITAEMTARAAAALPAARRHAFADYDAPGWADIAAERTGELARTMTDFLGDADRPQGGGRSGSVAGLTYRLEGEGPALLLLPFFLAASQWAPVVPLLARHFTVVTLGGPHLGGVATLEDRARAPSYRAMFRTLIEAMAPSPGETILDVGCGSGALDRYLAELTARANPITAGDVNGFLLAEAASLAAQAGLGEAIRFQALNAENLPFPDASFDCAFSVTVLEECDADRALAELVRVVRPGGRVGVIVRSIDLPQWWSFAVPPGLQARAALPPQSVGGLGVADASLYSRMARAGLAGLVCFPSLVTLDRPDGPIWRYREDHLIAQLSAAELDAWRQAREAARAGDLLFMAHPMHCAAGRKP